MAQKVIMSSINWVSVVSKSQNKYNAPKEVDAQNSETLFKTYSLKVYSLVGRLSCWCSSRWTELAEWAEDGTTTQLTILRFCRLSLEISLRRIFCCAKRVTENEREKKITYNFISRIRNENCDCLELHATWKCEFYFKMFFVAIKRLDVVD